MIQCRRLGYAAFTTPHLEDQANYFKQAIGLFESHRDDEKVVLATHTGLESIVLRHGKEVGLTTLAFEIAPALSPEDARRSLEEMGLQTEVRSSAVPSVGEVVACRDPKGTEIELFTSSSFVAPPIPERPVSPFKLGHVAYQVPDIEAVSDFYIRTFGFRKSDWAEGIAVFLRCNPDHHTVNFFTGPAKLDHIAFEVKDFSELVRAADYLSHAGYPLEWGPARHSAGHNCASYHLCPDGFPVELYAEMDQLKDEELGYFEPRPWHADHPQRPKNWGPQEFVRNLWNPQPFNSSGPNKN